MQFKLWLETYSWENSALKNYFKHKWIDVLTLANLILSQPKAMKELGIDSNKLQKATDEDDQEYLEKIKDSLTQDQIEKIIYNADPNDFLPAWAHMDIQRDKLLHRQTWLVHFSDNAEEIKYKGFTKGVEDIENIAYSKKWQSSRHGYNFAFIADSRDARLSAQKGTYGKNAVMFQSSGIKTFHWGDEEEQIVFYGPNVKPENMVLIKRDYDNFCVMGTEIVRQLYCNENFTKIVDWVMNNYEQYRRVF